MKNIKLILIILFSAGIFVNSIKADSLSNNGPSGGNNQNTPTYYNFEDLNQQAENYRYDFTFFNGHKPSTALASLPSKTPNGESAWMVRIKLLRMKRLKNWQTNYLTFPWDDPSIMEGDIVFLKGGDSVSKVIRNFSTWTHTAMIFDKVHYQSFESQKERGVNLYDYKKAWPKIVAYSVKRLNKYISNPRQVMEKSLKSYQEKKYLPQLIDVVLYTPFGFFYKWSNKDDLDSMYCSKLVWWTYKDYYDLDSERTTSHLFGERAWYDLSWILGNDFAWIGVSPDDIYFSRGLGEDIINAGLYDLQFPLDNSIF